MLNLFTSVLYVQLSPDRLTVRNPKTGASISEVPEVAITHSPKPQVLGVGNEARTHSSAAGVEIVNPFAHPRSMVSDFTVGELTLKAFMRRVQGSSLFRPAPRVVMHLLGEPAGGFTQVEIRAFHEMALGAGASKATVWQGRALGDHELLSGQFPSGGQVLS